MAATRFYFDILRAAAINPAFDAGWEQNGSASRVYLRYKKTVPVLNALTNSSAITIPITTTQDVLCYQFVSDPIPPQRIDTSCLFSLVIRVFENAITNNATLAALAKVTDSAGVIRGTLFSTFNTDTEFPLSGSAATRIVSQTAITAITTQPGDCLVIEIGAHATGPTAAGSFTMRAGYNAASDFALTTALTTDLNPWCEFSTDLFATPLNNYQSIKTGNGMSTGERIR